jgi:HAE1 family hydrophobic/amphiphilic exporter-1
MLSVTLVTVGIYSYQRLSIDMYPDVEIPVLTVQTLYPGASPETVEREVTKRIEESLNTISGVKHISSTTTEGMSMIAIEFRLGTNIHTAQQDAQSKINSIRAEFPADIKEPVIQRIDFAARPVVSIALESATADIKHLSSLAEKVVKKRLETVLGVGQVNIVGRPGPSRGSGSPGPRQAEIARPYLRPGCRRSPPREHRCSGGETRSGR